MYDEDGTVTGLCGVSTDITELVEREQALQETTTRLEAVLAASPAPILALDADGIVTLWNDAAETVFGRPAEEVLGEPFADLGFHHGDQRSAFADRLERVLGGEQFDAFDVERTSATGDRISLRIATAQLRNAEGVIDGVVAFATDQTTRAGNPTTAGQAREGPPPLELIVDADGIVREILTSRAGRGLLTADPATLRDGPVAAVFDTDTAGDIAADVAMSLDDGPCTVAYDLARLEGHQRVELELRPRPAPAEATQSVSIVVRRGDRR